MKTLKGFFLPRADCYGHSRNMPIRVEIYDDNLYRLRTETEVYFIQKKELKNYKNCPPKLINERLNILQDKMEIYLK